MAKVIDTIDVEVSFIDLGVTGTLHLYDSIDGSGLADNVNDYGIEPPTEAYEDMLEIHGSDVSEKLQKEIYQRIAETCRDIESITVTFKDK